VKRIIFLMLNATLVFNVAAKSIVDVYGTDSVKSRQILDKYQKRIGVSAYALDKAIKNMSKDGIPALSNEDRLKVKKLKEEIKNEFGFSYVDLDTIFYPGEKNIYSTVEVVEKKHEDRMRFVSSTNTKSYVTNKPKNDLINQMITYSNLGMQLSVTQQIDPKVEKCSVYHCTVGFEHPKLKHYLKTFNVGAVKERKLILDTLSSDTDLDRRTAAIFLVGHFTDPNEIISIVTPLVNDNSEQIRNDAMRVMGSTMRRANISKIDVYPFIKLLDSPYDTDRNKALFVLSEASKNKENVSKVIRYGRYSLLENLRLKQPNLHGWSYRILKQISGKDYGEYNVKGWSKWFSKEQDRQLT